VKEKLPDRELLDVPGDTPDMRLERHSVRCLREVRLELFGISREDAAEIFQETFILH